MFHLDELKRSDLPQSANQKKVNKEESSMLLSILLNVDWFLMTEPKEIIVDDASIDTLVEILAISKTDAMALYKQFDGNLDNIIASNFMY
jgi:hypothetical protein